MKKTLLLLSAAVLIAPLFASAQVYLPNPTPQQSAQLNTTGSLQYGTSAGTGNLPPYQALEPLPSGFSNGTYTNLPDYLNAMYLLAVTVGSLIAIVMLVTSGIRLMLSEAFTDRDKAKKRITNAVWGLVLLIGSFVFLYTINPDLLVFKFLPNQTQSGGVQQAQAGPQAFAIIEPNQTDFDDCQGQGKRLVIQSPGKWSCQPK